MGDAPTTSRFPLAPKGQVAAVCHRCGGDKSGPLVPCKGCGYVPQGEERATAWLFSANHLDEDELAHAADRIRGGERPDPPVSLAQAARVAMGAQPLSDAARQPMPNSSLALIGVGALVLTPLVGWAVWFGLRQERPVAAGQALRLTVPITLAMALFWIQELVFASDPLSW